MTKAIALLNFIVQSKNNQNSYYGSKCNHFNNQFNCIKESKDEIHGVKNSCDALALLVMLKKFMDLS